MAYSYTQEDGSVAICSLLSSIPEMDILGDWVIDEDYPDGGYYEVIGRELRPNAEVTEFPEDRLFRGAWRLVDGQLTTDLPLAKEIAHEKRRAKRAELLAPLDVEVTIPSMATQAEAARQVIRDANALEQIAVDGAGTEQELRDAMV